MSALKLNLSLVSEVPVAKIIKFPDQSDKVKSVRKVLNPNSYKNYAILGLGAVFLFALVLNISFQNQNTKSRELANFQGAMDESKLDDYILKSLNSSDSGTEIVFSKKPNQEDKLIFETLLGSYDIVKVNDRIAQIYLKPGYTSLKASMLPSVLAQYRKALGLEDLEYQLQENPGDNKKGTYQYSLVSKGQPIGSLKVTLDESSQIVSLNTKFK